MYCNLPVLYNSAQMLTIVPDVVADGEGNDVPLDNKKIKKNRH